MTDPCANHSDQAEREIIASLVFTCTHHGIEPAEELLADLREQLPVDAFYLALHRGSFELIIQLHEARKPWDMVTFAQAFRDSGRWPSVGPVDQNPESYAASLLEIPTLHHALHHAGIVREKYTRRQLQSVCHTTLRTLEEQGDADLEKLLADTQSQLLAITESSAPRDNFRRPKEGVLSAITRLHDAYENRGGITGLPSGLLDLDRTTTGWKPGQMIVICGSTGMGKTALMLNAAVHLSARCGRPVALFSLEMSYDELVERALYCEAQVSLQRARDGLLAERDFGRFNKAAETLTAAHLYIDDWSGLNVLQMQARARHAVRKLGCVALFADYLQLFEGLDDRDNDRTRELARISRGIKLCAKTLQVPFLVGAQLNRKPDERRSDIVINPYCLDPETQRPMKFKRFGVPQLGDLRECGAIGQDADLVIAPYRPWYWSKQDEDKVHPVGHLEWAQLLVLKHRNGPVGSIHCQYQADETRFITLPDHNGNPRETMMTNNPDQRQAAVHSEEEEPQE